MHPSSDEEVSLPSASHVKSLVLPDGSAMEATPRSGSHVSVVTWTPELDEYVSRSDVSAVPIAVCEPMLKDVVSACDLTAFQLLPCTCATGCVPP